MNVSPWLATLLLMTGCTFKTECPDGQSFDAASGLCKVDPVDTGSPDTGDTETGDTDSGDTDTGDSGDTETGDTSDTADTGDSDTADTGETADTALPTSTLHFIPADAAALAGTTLAIYAADAYWESIPDTTTPLATTTLVDDAFDLTWSPSADDLFEDPSYRGNTLGKFVAVVFVDTDASGGWTVGEELVGMPVYQLWFVKGAPTKGLASLGVGEGFTAMDLHATDLVDSPVTVPPLEIPVDDNLRQDPEITLSGTFASDFGPDDRFGIQYATDAGSVQQDAGLPNNPWLMVFSGTPDPALLTEPIPGVTLLTGYPYVYTDTNGSGEPDGREGFEMLPFTTEGNEAVVLWANQPTDVDTAYRLLVRLGISGFGWRACWVGEGGYTLIDDLAATSLEMRQK